MFVDGLKFANLGHFSFQESGPECPYLATNRLVDYIDATHGMIKEDNNKRPFLEYGSYHVPVGENVLYNVQLITATLGYEQNPPGPQLWPDLLHREDRPKMRRIANGFKKLATEQPEQLPRQLFAVSCRYQSRTGNYHRILSYLYLESATTATLQVNSYWLDITNHGAAPTAGFETLSLYTNAQSDQVLLLFGDLDSAAEPRFTERELEVIRVWGETFSNELACKRLGISKGTLAVHLRNMRRKLGVRRTVEVLKHLENR